MQGAEFEEVDETEARKDAAYGAANTPTVKDEVSTDDALPDWLQAASEKVLVLPCLTHATPPTFRSTVVVTLVWPILTATLPTSWIATTAQVDDDVELARQVDEQHAIASAVAREAQEDAERARAELAEERAHRRPQAAASATTMGSCQRIGSRQGGPWGQRWRRQHRRCHSCQLEPIGMFTAAPPTASATESPQSPSKPREETLETQHRLILIGDSNSGKTALIRRFSQDTFDSGGGSSTVSVEVSTSAIDVGGERVGLQCFDTAGQERFAPLTAPFYRQADGVMLVYDVGNRRSFERAIGYWASEVNHTHATKLPWRAPTSVPAPAPAPAPALNCYLKLTSQVRRRAKSEHVPLLLIGAKADSPTHPKTSVGTCV